MNTHNLEIRRVQYPNQSYDSAAAVAASEQMLVHSVIAYNGSGSLNDIAIGYKRNQSEVITTAGTNFLIQSKRTFGLVSIPITTADSSGAVFTVQYWNGSTFVPLTTLNAFSLTSIGQSNIVFNPPIDWARDASGYYAIRIGASLTPNFVAGTVKVCKLLAYCEDVLPGATLQIRFSIKPLLLQQGEDIIPFFAYASSFNSVETSYQASP